MNVYEKLNNAREEFHSLKLEKTGHNKFAGYKYFELGDFLIPALKVFKKHGLCGTISFGCGADIAKMCVVNVEKPDEYIAFESPMGSAQLKGCHDVQNIGAVETYQRRYLWVAALEIVEHDALDATTGKAEPEPARKRTGVIADVQAALPPLSAEDREYYGQLAWKIGDALANAGISEAYNLIVAEKLDNEQRIHLEAELPSAIRTSLKKEGERRRAEKAKVQPETQN